jgi:hypothetical protein
MTIRWPKTLKFTEPDPWWTAHLSRPEINAGKAPVFTAPVGHKDHPLVKAVMDRFPGAQIVKAREGEHRAAGRQMTDEEWQAYCENVVLKWRDIPFKDSRDLAELDRLRARYARAPFRAGRGVIESVGEYVRKIEFHRQAPRPETVALLSMDLKAEKKAARAAKRAAARANQDEPAAD